MSRLSLLALLLPIVAHAGAIPEDAVEHAYHYKAEPVSAGNVNATAPVAWARQLELTLKVRLDNDSTNYVIWSKHGVEVTTGGNAFVPKDKDDKVVILAPHEDKTQTFSIPDEAGRLHHRDPSVQINEIWTVRQDGPTLDAPYTHLPARSQQFEVGDFDCLLKGKPKLKTDASSAAYTCTFHGTKGSVGFIDESKAQWLIEDGTAFANEGAKGVQVLMPGDSFTVGLANTTIQPRTHKVDMQFANMQISWGGVFRQANLEPLAFPAWAFELDEQLTSEKNQ